MPDDIIVTPRVIIPGAELAFAFSRSGGPGVYALYNARTRVADQNARIAFVTTMLARGAQTHQALMVGHLTATDPAFKEQFAAAKSVLGNQTDPVTATRQAYNAVYSLLDQQAHLWAFVDNFYMFGLLALAGIPLVFLFKRIATVKKPAAAGH